MDSVPSGIIVPPRGKVPNLVAPTEEIWENVVGFEHNYEVSNCGRVRRKRKMNRWPALGLLAQFPNDDGYPSLYLRRHSGPRVHLAVHSLVLRAFCGESGGLVCRHLDGDKNNNQLANLAWGTQLENSQDKTRHGRTPKGETHRSAKLNKEIVKSIQADLLAMKQLEVAGKYGVSRSTVQRIAYGKSWQ